MTILIFNKTMMHIPIDPTPTDMEDKNFFFRSLARYAMTDPSAGTQALVSAIFIDQLGQGTITHAELDKIVDQEKEAKND